MRNVGDDHYRAAGLSAVSGLLHDDMQLHAEALQRCGTSKVSPVERPVVVEQHDHAVAHVASEHSEKAQEPHATPWRERHHSHVEVRLLGEVLDHPLDRSQPRILGDLACE